MKTLDFCAGSMDTAFKIMKAFASTSKWQFQPIFQSFWKSREALEATVDRTRGWVDKEGMVTVPFKKGVKISIWVQGEHYMISIQLGQTEPLYGLVAVMKDLDRGDYPVKIDKSDTITLKAAVAVAALALAQGGGAGSSGILMDMARDKVI